MISQRAPRGRGAEGDPLPLPLGRGRRVCAAGEGATLLLDQRSPKQNVNFCAAPKLGASARQAGLDGLAHQRFLFLGQPPAERLLGLLVVNGGQGAGGGVAGVQLGMVE